MPSITQIQDILTTIENISSGPSLYLEEMSGFLYLALFLGCELYLVFSLSTHLFLGAFLPFVKDNLRQRFHLISYGFHLFLFVLIRYYILIEWGSLHQSSKLTDVVDICWKVLDPFHFLWTVAPVVNQVDYYHLNFHHQVVVHISDLYCLDQLNCHYLQHWYVSNVSIIFDALCLFMHHLLCVLLHFVAFLCIFRN
jgi:hypothetical protein